MSKRNGNTKPLIHKNQLHPSHADTTLQCGGPLCEIPGCAVRACYEVHQRVALVSNMYLKAKGVTFVPDGDLAKALQRWKTMTDRHQRGDFRHSEDEMKAMKFVANWTLTLNAKLRGQEPPKLI